MLWMPSFYCSYICWRDFQDNAIQKNIQFSTKSRIFSSSWQESCVSRLSDQKASPVLLYWDTGQNARIPLCSWPSLTQTAANPLFPQARWRPHRHPLCPGTFPIFKGGNHLMQKLADLGKFAQRSQQLHHAHQCAAHAQVNSPIMRIITVWPFWSKRSRRPSLASGPAFTHLSRSEPSDENYVKVHIRYFEKKLLESELFSGRGRPWRSWTGALTSWRRSKPTAPSRTWPPARYLSDDLNTEYCILLMDGNWEFFCNGSQN